MSALHSSGNPVSHFDCLDRFPIKLRIRGSSPPQSCTFSLSSFCYLSALVLSRHVPTSGHSQVFFRLQRLHFSKILPPRYDLPGGSDDKVSACNAGRPGFNPWVGKIPWRRKWQPTPVLLPGKSHGWRSLVCYSPWGHKESLDTTEQLHFLSRYCLARSPPPLGLY